MENARVNLLSEAVHTALEEFEKQGADCGSLVLVEDGKEDRVEDYSVIAKSVVFLKAPLPIVIECHEAINTILDQWRKQKNIPKNRDLH